jgi:16S rRNA (uracil1498-N3)-methyltransferase
MPRRRFFIPQDRIRDGAAVLTPDEAHHLRDVLRLRAGEEVELFDGEGLGYTGKVECSGMEICIGSLSRLEPSEQRQAPLVLAAALIKPDRFEWMLQKGTELGVHRFLPLKTRFTTVRIPQTKLEARQERWRRIVREAAKQSRRFIVPEVLRPIAWADLVASPEYRTYARFMFHERASERLEARALAGEPLLLCVGPEGGWDNSESQAAERTGFRLISMGSRILRAETAAIAAVAVFQFLREQ